MSTENNFLKYNDELKNAIEAYHLERKISRMRNLECLGNIVNMMDKCMRLDAHLLIPVELEPDEENPENIQYLMRNIETPQGNYLAAFTDEEELNKGPETAVISFFMDALFENILMMESCEGLVVNPWGEPFYLTKLFVKLVVILSQLRKLKEEYLCQGETMWDGAEISKEKQAMYYSRMQDSLDEFQEYEDLSCFYWEIVGLYKDIFVKFWLDEKEVCIYQIAATGEGYVLKKENLSWQKTDRKDFSQLKNIERKKAEEMEDAWKRLSHEKLHEQL